MQQSKLIQITGAAAFTAAALMGITACGGGSSNSSPSPAGSFSFDGGSVDLNTLPSTWPSDAPTPKELQYQGGADIGSAINASWSGQGNVDDIFKELIATYKANGWTQEDIYGGSGENGGITAMVKGPQRAQIVAANENGKAVINIAIVRNAN